MKNRSAQRSTLLFLPRQLSVFAGALTKLIPLSRLRPGNAMRGAGFDVADLLESLDHAPQLHPIIVRAIAGSPNFEVIAGHRRVETFRQKGLRHIEAKVLADVDDRQAELLALEENLRRRALPDEPTALARLVELYEVQTPTRRG